MFTQAIPAMNERNLPSHFLNMDFSITLKSVRGIMVSATTTTHAGGSKVHILNRARQLSFLQNV